MLNLNKHTKTKPQPKPTVIFKNCSRVLLCTTVVHNTAQNSSDNFPSYPQGNHHSSDDVYWRGGDFYSWIIESFLFICTFTDSLAATLHGSRPGVQSASLIVTSLIT